VVAALDRFLLLVRGEFRRPSHFHAVRLGAHAAIYLNLAAKVKTLLETQTRRPGPVIVKG